MGITVHLESGPDVFHGSGKVTRVGHLEAISEERLVRPMPVEKVVRLGGEDGIRLLRSFGHYIDSVKIHLILGTVPETSKQKFSEGRQDGGQNEMYVLREEAVAGSENGEKVSSKYLETGKYASLDG